MTDNRKSFGVSGLFNFEEPTYYIEPISRAFLVWILHLLQQVLSTLSVKDRSGSSLSFIKHLPPFSRPMRSLLLGLFNTCLTGPLLSICSFPVPDGLHALYRVKGLFNGHVAYRLLGMLLNKGCGLSYNGCEGVGYIHGWLLCRWVGM